MTRLESYTNASATGVVCQLIANNTINNPGAPGVVYNPPQFIVSATFLAIAGTGVSAGAVVPVILGPDGNWHPIATATSSSAAGFLFLLQLNTPSDGVGLQITTTVTGGTLYLQTTAYVT
jgi:hypothetical protein